MAIPQRPRFLAERLGQTPRELAYTTGGGNSPQALVNRTALDIQAGDLDIAILAGGEAFRTYMRARRPGATLTGRRLPTTTCPTIIGNELEMVHEAEQARTSWLPVQFYPMFETALRAAAGRSVDEHQRHLGRCGPTSARSPSTTRTPGSARRRRPRRSRPSPTPTG